MKKLVFLLGAALLLSGITFNNAYAKSHFSKTATFKRFEIGTFSYNTAGEITGFVKKSTFGFNEVPYVSFKLPKKGEASMFTAWKNPNGEYFYSPTFDIATPKMKGYVALPNWNTVKATGLWKVRGFFSYNGGKVTGCSDCISFTVTPEPMAMVLYAFGGLPIAAHFIRRRKTLT